jgi:hypothetical protein
MMPSRAIFDYVHPVAGNLMRIWSQGLQGRERAKLDFKVDALETHGADLIPGVLAPTGIAAIFKLKVQGKVKLRPMVCEGPRDIASFTFLLGAKEIQWKYDPQNAPETAAEYRKDLIANPFRREAHERSNRQS